MSCYKYIAKNLQGNKIRGKLDAENEMELIITLKNYGYYALSYNIIKKRLNMNFRDKVTTKDIAIFCKQFSAIYSAGINICEALNILAKQCKNGTIRNSLSVIYNKVQMGEEFSYALEDHKSIYPEFMINMIAIGEQSGTLDKILIMLWEY